MGSKSKGTCPFQSRNRKDTGTHRRRPHEDRGRAGMMAPQARALSELPEAERYREQTPPHTHTAPTTSLQRECGPDDTLISGFWPPEQ